MAIAHAGEMLCRTACIIHDAGNAVGQGGFGAVFGSKNLKAVSAIGTGSITIHDPNALMELRLAQMKKYAFNFDTQKPSVATYFSSPPGHLADPRQKQKGGQRRW